MAGQGRNIVVEQVGSKIQVTADGSLWALAVPLSDSHESMISSGYVKLLDRYPTAEGHPFAVAPLDLTELYVLAEPRKVPHNIG